MSEFLSPNQTDYSPEALGFVSRYNQSIVEERARWRRKVEELRAEGFEAAIHFGKASRILGTATLSIHLGIREYTFTDRIFYGAKVAVFRTESEYEAITLLEPAPRAWDYWSDLTVKFAPFNPAMKYWSIDCYQTGKDETQYCSLNTATGEKTVVTLSGRCAYR